MRKVNTVIGQKVISLADGHQIASVKDVVIDAAPRVHRGARRPGSRAPVRRSHRAHRGSAATGGMPSSSKATTRSSRSEEPDIEPDAARAGRDEGLLDAGSRSGPSRTSTSRRTTAASSASRSPRAVVDDFASGRRFLPVGELDHVGDDDLRPTRGRGEPRACPGGTRARSARSRTSRQGHRRPRRRRARSSPRPGRPAGRPSTRGDEPDAPGADLVGRRSGADVTDADGRIIVANGQLSRASTSSAPGGAGQSDALRAAPTPGARRRTRAGHQRGRRADHRHRGQRLGPLHEEALRADRRDRQADERAADEGPARGHQRRRRSARSPRSSSTAPTRSS